MILVIAEKPSLGRDIADALPGAKTGGDRRYIKKGDYVITWVFGHMLTLKESDSVIHAGDPDEEGQLLIDELLRWFRYDKPVMRLDTGDTTRGGLIKALGRMKGNADCVN